MKTEIQEIEQWFKQLEIHRESPKFWEYYRKLYDKIPHLIQKIASIVGIGADFPNPRWIAELFKHSQFASLETSQAFFKQLASLLNSMEFEGMDASKDGTSLSDFFKNWKIQQFEEVLILLKEFVRVASKKNPISPSNKKYSPFAYGIRHLVVENFLNIKKIDIKNIPSDAAFIVFTGDNAEGKTTLLQAIAIGLYGHADAQRNFMPTNPKASIFLEANYLHKPVCNIVTRQETMLVQAYQQVCPCLAVYGAARLQLQSSESQDVQALRHSAIYNLFNNESPLLNIEYWFKIQKLKGEEPRIQAVQKLLIELMPTISAIQFGGKNTRLTEYPIFYVENGRNLTSQQLSAGNKSILTMFGDMLIRLYDAQPEIIEPHELQGIVLIDELETHLHPKWQKQLPILLTKHFPLVQFIVTTHSPIPFLGMPENTVLFNISKDNSGETHVNPIELQFSNLLPHHILTSKLFGLDFEDITSIQNQDKHQLKTEDTMSAIEKNEAVRTKLRNYAAKKVQFPNHLFD